MEGKELGDVLGEVVVRSSVRPFVRPSVRPSARPSVRPFVCWRLLLLLLLLYVVIIIMLMIVVLVGHGLATNFCMMYLKEFIWNKSFYSVITKVYFWNKLVVSFIFLTSIITRADTRSRLWQLYKSWILQKRLETTSTRCVPSLFSCHAVHQAFSRNVLLVKAYQGVRRKAGSKNSFSFNS